MSLMCYAMMFVCSYVFYVLMFSCDHVPMLLCCWLVCPYVRMFLYHCAIIFLCSSVRRFVCYCVIMVLCYYVHMFVCYYILRAHDRCVLCPYVSMLLVFLCSYDLVLLRSCVRMF